MPLNHQIEFLACARTTVLKVTTKEPEVFVKAKYTFKKKKERISIYKKFLITYSIPRAQDIRR